MEEFFQQYTVAFNTLDAEAISQLYRLPCAISDADGVQAFTDKPSLISKFQANCHALKNAAYQKVSFNIINIDNLGADKVSVI